MLDAASKGTIENEFHTTSEDEAIIKILEKGEVQSSEVRQMKLEGNAAYWHLSKEPGRGGNKNDTMGGMIAHGPN